MQVSVTPEIENQLRARGISRDDIAYALANHNYDIPAKNFPGVRQIMAPIGKGRLFLKYRRVSDTEGVLVEGFWNPRK